MSKEANVNAEQQFDYLKRLVSPYTKYGERKCFALQFLQGSGNELEKKF